MNMNTIIHTNISKYKHEYYHTKYIYIYVFGYKSYKSMKKNAHMWYDIQLMALGW